MVNIGKKTCIYLESTRWKWKKNGYRAGIAKMDMGMGIGPTHPIPVSYSFYQYLPHTCPISDPYKTRTCLFTFWFVAYT